MQIARLSLLSFLFIVVLSSCETSVNEEVPAQIQKETQQISKESQNELNNKRKAALRLKEEESKLLSNYKYITSADDLSIFADLLKRSSHGKMSHNQPTTIFAPSDKAFAANKDLTHSLTHGSKELIDQFVGGHIVSDSNFKEFFKAGKATALNGKEIRFSDGDEIRINGNLADGNFVSTKTGTVYYLEILSIK